VVQYKKLESRDDRTAVFNVQPKMYLTKRVYTLLLYVKENRTSLYTTALCARLSYAINTLYWRLSKERPGKELGGALVLVAATSVAASEGVPAVTASVTTGVGVLAGTLVGVACVLSSVLAGTLVGVASVLAGVLSSILVAATSVALAVVALTVASSSSLGRGSVGVDGSSDKSC
jgi:hypothetical protein